MPTVSERSGPRRASTGRASTRGVAPERIVRGCAAPVLAGLGWWRVAVRGVAIVWLSGWLGVAIAEASGVPAARGPQSAGRDAPRARLVVIDPAVSRPVWIDGRFAGRTPLRVDSLAAGVVTVTVGEPFESDLWRPPRIFTLTVREGETDSLALGGSDVFGLTETTGSRSIPRAVSTVLRPGPARARGRVVLPVAAVVLGVAGVWAREAGDRSYEDYTRTLDRARMRGRLDRARELDRLAVACWIGAEACLVTAAWQWLRGEAGPEDLSPIPRRGGSRDDGWGGEVAP